MNKVKRNYSIDIARGIAILFVVSWHCRVGNFGVTMWVMPLFFFIMGVFYHTPISLKLQIRKKTNQLLIPFVIWSIPYFIYYLFTKPFLAFVKMWLNPYEIMNGPSWFLLCMFECYIIYYGIKKIEVEYRGGIDSVLIYHRLLFRNLSIVRTSFETSSFYQYNSNCNSFYLSWRFVKG